MWFREAHVEQTTRFFCKGAIKPGTIQSGCAGLETRIEIDSDEPPERIRQLVKLAQYSCFTRGALRDPVPMEVNVQLNGSTLTIDEPG